MVGLKRREIMKEKDPELEEFVEWLAYRMTAKNVHIAAGLCSWCGMPAEYFRNQISQEEYQISGFCQNCQDETFGID